MIISTTGLIIISLGCALVIAGFILRICYKRFAARLCITGASLFLVAYSALDFFTSLVRGFFDISDAIRMIFFIFAVLLFLYNLIVFIKKY